MCATAAITLLIDMKSYTCNETVLLLLLISYMQYEPASAKMFSKSATPLQ